MTDPAPVPRPADFTEFCGLADALFALNELGGPLHVHLEDHNTELLTGDDARETITNLTEALARIEAGEVPAEATKMVPGKGWPEGHEVHDTAYYYGHPDRAAELEQPLQQIRLAIAILTVTAPWSEAQADAAYAEWQRRDGGTPCSCSRYPSFTEEGTDQ